jgi:hypothetical protein
VCRAVQYIITDFSEQCTVSIFFLEDGGRFTSQKAEVCTVITERTSHLASPVLSTEHTSGWVGVVVMLYICIWEVLGLNLGQDVVCPGFPQLFRHMLGWYPNEAMTAFS